MGHAGSAILTGCSTGSGDRHLARLSKADWNKLKKATGMYKGTLLRPSKAVKWAPDKDRKRWAKIAKAKSGSMAADKGGSDAV
jgi:hypothetical protein